MRKLVIPVLLGLLPGLAAAQSDPEYGPVFDDFGPTWEITDPDFVTPLDAEYRLVFDVPVAPDDPAVLNRWFESSARFLNMQARAGVAPERMKVAVVVHGAATFGVMHDEAYRERNGIGNPNRDMLEALMDYGVDVVVCGQSAASRGVDADDLLPGVRMALSAMTAQALLQAQGYALIQY